MTSCKNSLILALLCCLAAFSARAQDIAVEEDDVFDIPFVRISGLNQIKPDAVGVLLSSDHRLLNENAWKGARFSNVMRRFRKTRRLPPYEAAETLRRKLLLLAAEPPENTPEGAFVKGRLKELYRRGYFENVSDILAQLPPGTTDLTTADIEINTDFLTNRPNEACAQVTKAPDDGIERQRQNVVCAALKKDENKTQLPLAMLEEQGANDAFLSETAEALMSGKGSPDSLPEKATPLNLFLLRRFKIAPPAPFWKSNADDIRAALAALPPAPLEKRIETAERLVQRGILPPEDLIRLYKTPVFKNGLPKDAAPAVKRAFLFREALKPRNDEERAKRLTAYLEAARKAGVFNGGAFAAKEILKGFDGFYDISPITANAEIMKALVLNGERFKAENIMSDYYQRLMPTQTEAESWYVVKIAYPGRDFLLPRFERMMAYKEKHPDENGDMVREVDRLMLIFETLGKVHPSETWMYTSFSDASPEKKFADELHANKPPKGVPSSVGERALEALEHLDGSFAGLLETLRRLKYAGLEDEARKIATQAVTAGLSDLK